MMTYKIRQSAVLGIVLTVVMMLCCGQVSARRSVVVVPKSEVRTVSIAHNLVMDGPFDVILSPAIEPGRIEIESDSAFLPYIETEVSNLTLTVRVAESKPRKVQPAVPITIRMHHDWLNITLSGGISVVCDAMIQNGDMAVKMSGGASARMNLMCMNLEMELRDYARFEGETEVVCANVTLWNNSNCTMRGPVEKMVVYLTDKAQLDSRKLIDNVCYVNCYKEAHAEEEERCSRESMSSLCRYAGDECQTWLKGIVTNYLEFVGSKRTKRPPCESPRFGRWPMGDENVWSTNHSPRPLTGEGQGGEGLPLHSHRGGEIEILGPATPELLSELLGLGNNNDNPSNLSNSSNPHILSTRELANMKREVRLLLESLREETESGLPGISAGDFNRLLDAAFYLLENGRPKTLERKICYHCRFTVLRYTIYKCWLLNKKLHRDWWVDFIVETFEPINCVRSNIYRHLSEKP